VEDIVMECVGVGCCSEKGTSLDVFEDYQNCHRPSQGFKNYIEAEGADILILTETKVRLKSAQLSYLLTMT
jgi:hypothetical protein